MQIRLIPMKKILFLAVITAAVSSASCRKQRTCECVTTETTVSTGVGGGTDTEISSYKQTMDKQRRREFITKTNCFSTRETNTYNFGPNTDVVTTENKCELK
jgi:hypothetical protein